LIVSDQDSIECAFKDHHYGNSQANVSALGLLAGCDQNDGETYATSVGDAVKQGLVNESVIDTALSRILTQRFKVGAFDPASPSINPYRGAEFNESALNAPAHTALALEAARGAIVLLRNDPYTHARTESPSANAVHGSDGASDGTRSSTAPATELVLPLPQTKGLKIGLVGPVANLIQHGGEHRECLS
jgi:beta-glucosidase-like glycosyl hydrolase